MLCIMRAKYIVSHRPFPHGSSRLEVHGAEPHTVEILDACGKLVRSVSGVGAAEYRIDRARLRPGAYVVKLSEGAKSEIRRVVIR